MDYRGRSHCHRWRRCPSVGRFSPPSNLSLVPGDLQIPGQTPPIKETRSEPSRLCGDPIHEKRSPQEELWNCLWNNIQQGDLFRHFCVQLCSGRCAHRHCGPSFKLGEAVRQGGGERAVKVSPGFPIRPLQRYSTHPQILRQLP